MNALKMHFHNLLGLFCTAHGKTCSGEHNAHVGESLTSSENKTRKTHKASEQPTRYAPLQRSVTTSVRTQLPHNPITLPESRAFGDVLIDVKEITK